METKENITTEELVVQPARELEEVEVIEEEPIIENTSTTEIPQEYQEDIKQAQVNPGTPIVIIHNDNSSNANNQSTVQQTVQQNTTQEAPQQALVHKSKWVAFFLCLFLGTLGAHQFYCGWIGKGFIMLALSLIGVGWIISFCWAVWNLIQILMGSFPVKGGLPV